MKIQNTYSPKFGMRYKLSDETLKQISTSTKLSVEELRRLPMAEAEKVMKERGSLKEPSKLFQWLSDKYKRFGEKTGLLKKEYNIYTDVD